MLYDPFALEIGQHYYNNLLGLVLALWPLEEVAMKAAKCTAIATYDANLKLINWHIQKNEKGNLPC